MAAVILLTMVVIMRCDASIGKRLAVLFPGLAIVILTASLAAYILTRGREAVGEGTVAWLTWTAAAGPFALCRVSHASVGLVLPAGAVIIGLAMLHPVRPSPGTAVTSVAAIALWLVSGVLITLGVET